MTTTPSSVQCNGGPSSKGPSTTFLDNVPPEKQKLAKAIVKKLRGIVELEKHSSGTQLDSTGTMDGTMDRTQLDNSQLEKLRRKSDLISRILNFVFFQYFSIYLLGCHCTRLSLGNQAKSKI